MAALEPSFTIEGGVAVPNVPKIQALRGWGGGGLDFLRIYPHALRDLKGDHSSPKSDIYPQKCSFSPKIDHSTLFSNDFAHVIIPPQKFSFSPRIDHSTFSLSNKFAHSC